MNLHPIRRHRSYHSASNEAGLSLIETIIAIALAGILLVAGLAGLTSMMVTTVAARENQASAEVLAQEVERIRGGDYAAVAMVEADLRDGPGGALDPAITESVPGDYRFDHDGDAGSTGATPPERIIVAAGGGINDHRQLVERNNTPYTLSVYVTNPADAAGDYRRVTVRAEWDNPVRRRQATTFVTETRRGLPLPKFSFGNQVSVTVITGATLVLPVTLTNRGARDAWNLTTSTNPVPSPDWNFTWYKDTNGNGVFDVGEDADRDGVLDTGEDADGDNALDFLEENPANVLTDTTEPDSLIDTGLLETDQVLRLLAVVPAGATAGNVTVRLTATSNAQPLSATAIQFIDNPVIVQEVGCAPCTRYFKNTSADPANSTRKTNMPVTPTGPTGVGPFNFDTDVDSDPGRLIIKGGSGEGEPDASKMANWRYSVANAVTFTGNVKVRLYARVKGSDPKVVKFNVYVRRRTSASCMAAASNLYTWVTPTTTGTQTINPLPASFTQVDVEIPVNFSLAANRCFEIKVVVDGSSGDDVWIAYETASYPARVEMPVVSPGVM